MPCSTGEEPYSIAIWLLENWPLVDQYDIEIIGSDIDTGAVALARAANLRQTRADAPAAALVEKYFEPDGAETWKIIDDLRQSVRFTAANIVDPAETRPHGQFDVIFCRNVLIYFDDASRRIAAENLFENLLPGGFICLGHTESMSRISPLFDVARFADAIVYQRPAAVTTWMTTHANESSSSTTRAWCGCITAPRSRGAGFRGRGSAERARSAGAGADGALRPADRRRQHAADGRAQLS